MRLEFCMNDWVGLLLDVIRIFWENGFLVVWVDIIIWYDKVINVFYVVDVFGCLVNMKVVEVMCEMIGSLLEVKGFLWLEFEFLSMKFFFGGFFWNIYGFINIIWWFMVIVWR